MVLSPICEAGVWKACGRQSKCETCKTKFKPLRKNQVGIEESPIDGLGLFLKALRGIEKGRVIIVVEGRRRRKRMWTRYSYGLNAKVYIEPCHFAKFVNQSNKPNARIQKWNCGDKEGLVIVAIKQIEYKEEITIDYRDETRRYGV